MKEVRETYKILVRKPDSKRPFGRLGDYGKSKCNKITKASNMRIFGVTRMAGII
jgi:hypothetical protein